MRSYTLLFALAALVFCAVPSFCASAAKVNKIFLTKIDAAGADGLCLHISGKTLALTNLSGDPATSFKIDPATLSAKPVVNVKYVVRKGTRVYQSAQQSWKLSDSIGEGVKIVDNSLNTLVIVSKVDHAITYYDGGIAYPVPGHSFVLINNPSKDAVLDYGESGWVGFNGDYKEKMWPIYRPTEVVISPNESGIKGGFPAIVENTHCDQSISMSGN